MVVYILAKVNNFLRFFLASFSKMKVVAVIEEVAHEFKSNSLCFSVTTTFSCEMYLYTTLLISSTFLSVIMESM